MVMGYRQGAGVFDSPAGSYTAIYEGGTAIRLRHNWVVEHPTTKQLYAGGYRDANTSMQPIWYVARCDSDFSNVSTYRTNNGAASQSWDAVIDSSGNIFAVGERNNQSIIWKYDSNCTLQGYKLLSEASTNKFLGITEGPDGNLYITGYTQATAYDCRVVVMDKSLNVLDSFRVGGTGNDAAYAVEFDSSGNMFIAGHSSTGSHSSWDLWVAKVDMSGSPRTVTSLAMVHGNSLYDYGYDMKIDSSGNVFVVGTIRDSGSDQRAWIGKFDNDLSLITSREYGATGADVYARTLDLDSSGNVYVGMTPGGFAKFDNSLNEVYFGQLSSSQIYSSLITSTNTIVFGGTEDETVNIDYAMLFALNTSDTSAPSGSVSGISPLVASFQVTPTIVSKTPEGVVGTDPTMSITSDSFSTTTTSITAQAYALSTVTGTLP
jgi:hypothetical protein